MVNKARISPGVFLHASLERGDDFSGVFSLERGAFLEPSPEKGAFLVQSPVRGV